MANIDKIQVGDTTYDIVSSSNGTNTFTSGDVADGSATAWTTVAALASGETTSSILGKISNMFKNIRYLYKQLGTTDISGVGASVTAAISALNTNKAASDHTHSLATTAAAGFMPALGSGSSNFLREDGEWASAGSTYATVSTAAPGLAPTLSGNNTQYLNGEGSYTVPTNTTYAFSNNNPTLAWNTTSTVGTVGGVALTVKLPANPNTNTTYGTNVGCYGTLSGTTLTLNTRNFRV